MKDPHPTASLDRLSTGVIGLDKLIQGGFPKSSWIVVIGPPGWGKSTLARQFLYTHASNHRSAYLLSTSDPKELIYSSMLSFGWEPNGVNAVRVIDGYSWRKGIQPSLNLRNLTDVSMGVADYFNTVKVRPDDSPCLGCGPSCG